MKNESYDMQHNHNSFQPNTCPAVHIFFPFTSFFFFMNSFWKHFDQLNSKCECHWIWHRWMISPSQTKENPKKKHSKKNRIFIFFVLSLSWWVHRWKWSYGWGIMIPYQTRHTLTHKKMTTNILHSNDMALSLFNECQLLITYLRMNHWSVVLNWDALWSDVNGQWI